MKSIIKSSKIIVGSNWGAIAEEGWFGAKTIRGVDLDMGCIEVDRNDSRINTLCWENKELIWGHISPDDMEGDTGGDDQQDNEWLEIDLTKLAADHELWLTISNYTEGKLEAISHFDYRIYSGRPNDIRERFYFQNLIEERFEINPLGIFLGILKNDNGQWNYHPHNQLLEVCDIKSQYESILNIKR